MSGHHGRRGKLRTRALVTLRDAAPASLPHEHESRFPLGEGWGEKTGARLNTRSACPDSHPFPHSPKLGVSHEMW